jgi:hypothetical protein
LTDTYGVIGVGAQVWATAGKAVLAAQASSKVDNRSLMLSNFQGVKGIGRRCLFIQVLLKKRKRLLH